MDEHRAVVTMKGRHDERQQGAFLFTGHGAPIPPPTVATDTQAEALSPRHAQSWFRLLDLDVACTNVVPRARLCDTKVIKASQRGVTNLPGVGRSRRRRGGLSETCHRRINPAASAHTVTMSGVGEASPIVGTVRTRPSRPSCGMRPANAMKLVL